MTNWENLVSGDELAKVARSRKKLYVESKERREDWEQLASEGYEHIRDYKDKRYIRVRKSKDPWAQFENTVWRLFYDMGFIEMNRDDQFRLSYGVSDSSNKQIDVFAFDGDTALIVECKERQTDEQLKGEIEALGGNMKGFRDSIRDHYGSGIKVKAIWAISENILSKANKERLKEFEIELFRPETIDYYAGLTQQLGSAAKYQLFGRLFQNQKIGKLDYAVPAVRGKMGGYTYYSFSIEPSKLLKISYVLHQNAANDDMSPTYQRVIKKSRLQQIRKFINNGGYFPNSVIISLDTGKKGLAFDQKQGGDDDIAKLGILHLPSKYHSANIIDGQHRLYGYTDTEYAETNTIPVVAFENLSQSKQVDLFMQINENQKSVPKNLRNTLNADMLADSSDCRDRRQSLRSRIGQDLGSDTDSPLCGHVLIGDDKSDKKKCVTLDSIDRGLKAGQLLTTFDSNNQPVAGRIGLFDDANLATDYAEQHLYPFLIESFKYLQDELPDEWERGEENDGILSNNVGINALLRVFSDVVEYLTETRAIDTRKDDAKGIVSACKKYYAAIVDFCRDIDPALRREIRSQFGGKGPIKHWRYLQKAIHDRDERFNPEGYEEWWADNSKQYNAETEEKLKAITEKLKENVADYLEQSYGNDWLNLALPTKLDFDLASQVGIVNNQRNKEGKSPLNKWDLVGLDALRTIANDGGYWSRELEYVLSEPEFRHKKASRAVKTKWLSDLIEINDGLDKPGYSVSQSDYALVCSVHNWVLDDENKPD